MQNTKIVGCIRTVMLVLFLFLVNFALVTKVHAQDITWLDQFGSEVQDEARAVVIDNQDNRIVFGNTRGALSNQYSWGGYDLFVRKYNNNGLVLWTKQFGTAYHDTAGDIAIDSFNNIYFVSFDNHAGVTLWKIAPDGTEIWKKHTGSQYDNAIAIDIDDSGMIYVGGVTWGQPWLDRLLDVYLRKFDSDGNEIWNKVFGTSKDDRISDIFVSINGNIFVSGTSSGYFYEPHTEFLENDAYLIKLDAYGNQIWVKRTGFNSNAPAGSQYFNYGTTVVADSSENVYLGATVGVLSGYEIKGIFDAMVRKYDNSGNELWTRILANGGHDGAQSLALSPDELSLYFGGYTENSSGTGFDAFLRKYTSYGAELWTRQFGNPEKWDEVNSVAVDGNGRFFTAGYTVGDRFMPGENEFPDAFIAELTDSTVQIFGPSDPIALGSSIAIQATFIDPTSANGYQITWDWGDGTSDHDPFTSMTETGQLTREHTYSASGVYSITVTVTGASGYYSGQSSFEYVVIYDPDGGSIRGSGRIESPPGAYSANPTLTGEARFGFSSKYARGSQIPTGNTQFIFRVADFKFVSKSYDWLVVAGAKAIYKGLGEINGVGNYGFIISGIDGSISGGGGVDKFRLKVWDTVTGEVIYDNQAESGDSSAPTTPLTNGRIVISQ